VQLLLLLHLQLHGTPAPFSLLEDLQLSLTADTAQGAPVTKVGPVTQFHFYDLHMLSGFMLSFVKEQQHPSCGYQTEGLLPRCCSS
jgi:hypothetical protein